MDEENVLNFVSITSCDPDKAAQYLRLTDNNLEQAIQLFFDSPNLDFGPATTSNAPAATSSAQIPINVDSDDDMSDFNAGAHTATPPVRSNLESDEELARSKLKLDCLDPWQHTRHHVALVVRLQLVEVCGEL